MLSLARIVRMMFVSTELQLNLVSLLLVLPLLLSMMP
jgi:hypothetical protein